jgi:methylated-DNA-[protein]-cysteine S-methyltransferase
MTTVHWATAATPAGPFTVLADDDAVLASGWTADPAELAALARLVAPLRPAADLGPVTKAVRAYLDGDLAAIDTVPVRQPAGAFLTVARAALREVRPGAPVTYTELAARAGRPAAVRAAAAACAGNSAALFVPCHRVVRTDGGLGGFRWGLPVKRWLLDHEAAHG